MASECKTEAQQQCLIVGLACEDIIILVDHYPKEDEKLRCDGRLKKRGGNASSSATVMALLGSDNVEFMGPLSSMKESSFVINEMKKYNVNSNYCIFNENCDMVKSYILLCTKTGSRTIINYPALNPLTCLDFEKKITNEIMKKKLKMIHFEARWMDELFKILKYIESFNENNLGNKIFVSIEIEKERLLNNDKFEYKDGENDSKTKYIVNDLIFEADLVFFSKQLIVSRGYHETQGARPFICDMIALYLTQVDKTIEKGHDSFTLVVPWGEQGCYGVTMNKEKLHIAAKHAKRKEQSSKTFIDAFIAGIAANIIHSKAYPPEKVIDTIGAGDTFIGAYLHALAQRKMDTKNCMDFACKVAGFKVGTMGFDKIKDFVSKSKNT